MLRGWFKGNDTTTLCRYLEWKFSEVLSSGQLKESDIAYVQSIYDALVATNTCLSTMFNAGLWLEHRERNNVISSLKALLSCFKKAADHAYSINLTRFKLQPKYHLTCEVLYKLMCDKRRGSMSINPIAWATQLDEDFVGRLCVFSRVVSGRTLAAKTIERYKIALRAAWEKNMS